MKEYDQVKLLVSIENIPKDSIGTIVYVYKDINVFEVEFVINNKVLVETLLLKEIEKYG